MKVGTGVNTKEEEKQKKRSLIVIGKSLLIGDYNRRKKSI